MQDTPGKSEGHRLSSPFRSRASASSRFCPQACSQFSSWSRSRSQSSIDERNSASPSYEYAEDDTAEDRNWNNHNTADLNKVICLIHGLCDLSLPPYEGNKVQSIKVVHSVDSQPPSFYHPPISETSFDVLEELDEEISAPQSGKKSKKLSKLLPYLAVQGNTRLLLSG